MPPPGSKLGVIREAVKTERGFPGGSARNNPPARGGDTGSIPGSGRPPGIGNDKPLQYFCLENSMDRGAWWAIVCGVTKSQTRLSTHRPSREIRACPGNFDWLMSTQYYHFKRPVEKINK